jgi:ribosomal protein L11 methyltransferase
MTFQPAVWRLSLIVPRHAAEAFAEALESLSGAVTWPAPEETTATEIRLDAFLEAEPDGMAVRQVLEATAAACSVAAPRPDVVWLPPRDWLDENRRAFEPFTVGRYFVHGSDYHGPLPAARLPLKVDAGLAFGSGRHESTAGCLKALDGLAHRHIRRVLDMGCGSGILSIAAAHTWTARVLASDVDPAAVRVAAANAQANGVAARVRVILSDGYAAREIRQRRPYDLIVANILAKPLRRMAPDLARNLRAGGFAVLAGFVAADSGVVLDAHRQMGLVLVLHIDVGGWRTLVLRRPRHA